AGERVVDRVGEGLGRGRRAVAAQGGDRERRDGGRSGDDRGHEGDESSGRDRAQEAHVVPSSERAVSGVARDSEISLRAGNSIVKRAPSAYALPPCRSAVERTIARPSPEPGSSCPPRQNRSNARSSSPAAGPGPSSETARRAMPSRWSTLIVIIPRSGPW